MSLEKPLRKDVILPRQIGDEWILWDTEKKSVHIINATAEFVWNMCDGVHSLTDMEKCMRDKYQMSDGVDIKKDLEEIIQTFSDIGVLAQ